MRNATDGPATPHNSSSRTADPFPGRRRRPEPSGSASVICSVSTRGSRPGPRKASHHRAIASSDQLPEKLAFRGWPRARHPRALLSVPWQARHTLASAPSAAAAYRIASATSRGCPRRRRRLTRRSTTAVTEAPMTSSGAWRSGLSTASTARHRGGGLAGGPGLEVAAGARRLRLDQIEGRVRGVPRGCAAPATTDRSW